MILTEQKEKIGKRIIHRKPRAYAIVNDADSAWCYTMGNKLPVLGCLFQINIQGEEIKHSTSAERPPFNFEAYFDAKDKQNVNFMLDFGYTEAVANESEHVTGLLVFYIQASEDKPLVQLSFCINTDKKINSYSSVQDSDFIQFIDSVATLMISDI